jgi:hypothetical protein
MGETDDHSDNEVNNSVNNTNSVNHDNSGNNTNNGNHNNSENNTNNAPINYPANDLSNNNLDLVFPPIVDLSLNETITQPGLVIVNQQGTAATGEEITHTTFTTTDPTLDVQITENLVEIVGTYYDNEQNNSVDKQLLDEIRLYAGKIQCSDFHGKGTIDDYTELFQAAAKIANESKQMTLDVEIEGFEDFAQAADDLSALFQSFIIRLDNVNIINDAAFLTSISIALRKIWNLSEVFGRFKETILATSTIKLPKSAHDTKLALEGVMDEINCAMNYISHFVNPTGPIPNGAELSSTEKNVITQAVNTIENWNVLCDQGVSIAMANDPDLKFIKEASNELKETTKALQTATNTLKSKLAAFNVKV